MRSEVPLVPGESMARSSATSRSNRSWRASMALILSRIHLTDSSVRLRDAGRSSCLRSRRTKLSEQPTSLAISRVVNPPVRSIDLTADALLNSCNLNQIVAGKQQQCNLRLLHGGMTR